MPRLDREQYTLRAYDFAARGEATGSAKLTDDKVRQARESYEKAQFAIAYIRAHYSAAGLARKYGVSRSAMDRALKGETWGHV